MLLYIQTLGGWQYDNFTVRKVIFEWYNVPLQYFPPYSVTSLFNTTIYQKIHGWHVQIEYYSWFDAS